VDLLQQASQVALLASSAQGGERIGSTGPLFFHELSGDCGKKVTAGNGSQLGWRQRLST
jgi:hypothetical protein